jgi:PAS domain S-box-containing protein
MHAHTLYLEHESDRGDGSMSYEMKKGEESSNTDPKMLQASSNAVQVEDPRQHVPEPSAKETSNNQTRGSYALKDKTDVDNEKNSVVASDLSEKYRLIALNTSDLIAFTTFDVNPVYTFVSPSHKKLLGYDPEELLGKPGFDFIHKDDKHTLLTTLLNYLDAKLSGALAPEKIGVAPVLDYRVIDKSGRWHFIRSTIDLANDELLFISKDITELKQVEDALRKSEEKFIRTFESSPVAICVTRFSDGAFLEVNKSLEKLIGCTRSELLGQTTIGLNVWEDPNERALLFEELGKTGSVYNREFRFRSKKGEILFTRYSGEVIDFSGEKCVVSVLIDITDIKKANELLRKSEEQYRLVTENASDIIWTMDMNLRFTYVSPSNEKLTGYSNEEILNITLDTLLTPESVELALKTFAEEMELEGSGTRDPARYVTIELNEIKKDGTTVPIEARMCLLRNASHEPVGILGITREIMERKQQEIALKKSEEKFVKAFQNSPIAISITRLADGKFIEVNDSFEKFFGLSRAELFTKTTIEAGLWFDIKDRSHVVEMLSTKGMVHDSELKFCTKEGIKVARCSAELLDVNNERCFISTLVDITEQKKIEESLRENEAKYRGIVENTKDVVILTLPDGTISYLSPACSEVFGYNPSELMGKVPEIYYPRDIDRVREAMSTAFQGKSRTNLEYRIVTKKGETKWVSHSWSPIYGESQNLRYIVGVVRDISESKRFEQSLKEKIDELERYKNITVDREIKMVELKNEINELRKQVAQKSRESTIKGRKMS